MKKLVFQGRLMKLFQEKRQLPNGFHAHLEIVEHPGAVLIIPFLNRDTAILLRQYRPVIRKYIYEFPAGTLEKSESATACAKRELVEEIGFHAKKLKKLGTIYPVPGYSTEKIHIFRAWDLVKRKQDIQDDEIIRSKPVTRKDVQKLFRSGKIIDAKTLCALAFAGWI